MFVFFFFWISYQGFRGAAILWLFSIVSCCFGVCGGDIVVVRFLFANSLQVRLQLCVIFGCHGILSLATTLPQVHVGVTQKHMNGGVLLIICFLFFLSAWGFMVDVRRALRSGDIR